MKRNESTFIQPPREWVKDYHNTDVNGSPGLVHSFWQNKVKNECRMQALCFKPIEYFVDNPLAQERYDIPQTQKQRSNALTTVILNNQTNSLAHLTPEPLPISPREQLRKCLPKQSKVSKRHMSIQNIEQSLALLDQSTQQIKMNELFDSHIDLLSTTGRTRKIQLDTRYDYPKIQELIVQKGINDHLEKILSLERKRHHYQL